MERIKHLLEALTKDHGLLSIWSFLHLGILSFGKRKKDSKEVGFLGDNAPFIMIDKLKKV